jgi:hypothetical protein
MGLEVEQEVHGNAIVRGFFLSYVGFGQGRRYSGHFIYNADDSVL